MTSPSVVSNVSADVLDGDEPLALRVLRAFGHPDDEVPEVERRAREHLAEYRSMVWEGDPQTFQFSYVSAAAVDILGYPIAKWYEPGFWADHIVHPDDRRDAVAFCALATGQNRNHDFRYRALTADGRVVTLLDAVQVRLGGRGIAVKLRGLMLEVSDPVMLDPAPPRRLADAA